MENVEPVECLVYLYPCLTMNAFHFLQLLYFQLLVNVCNIQCCSRYAFFVCYLYSQKKKKDSEGEVVIEGEDSAPMNEVRRTGRMDDIVELREEEEEEEEE